MKLQRRSALSVTMVSLVGGLGVLLLLLVLGTVNRGSDLERSFVGHGAQEPSVQHIAGPPVALAALPEAENVKWQPLALLPQVGIPTEVACTNLVITTTDSAPFNNRSLGTAAAIANYTDQSLLTGAKGVTATTWADYYRLDNATPGYKYTVQAKPDYTTNYNLGIIVYNHNQVPIITDTNTFDNNFGSVSLVADSFGPYYFKIFQISEQCSGHTYSLILGSTAPTPSPSPTVTPTPSPTGSPTPELRPTWMMGYDQYEPNYNFQLATTIAPGIDYDLNFIPWGGAEVDNDYFKIRVKPGLQLTCYTSDLDPGVDPRLALYSGPGDGYFVMANDDVQLGDFNSRLSYYATFEGYVYLLVGQGERMQRQDTVNSDYVLTCELDVPGIPTPRAGTATPESKAPWPTAAATPRPTSAPTATPTPATSVIETPTPDADVEEVEMIFRLVTTPEPVTTTPEPGGFRTFRVLVYLDENLDLQMGAGEGVTGFFVLVLTPDGRRELAQGYTDEQGQLSFTVPTVSTVRVLVPLLGFDRLIDASRPEVRVRIVPPTLPNIIP